MSERELKAPSSIFDNAFFDIQTWERDRRGMPSCRLNENFVWPTKIEVEQSEHDVVGHYSDEERKKFIQKYEDLFKEQLIREIFDRE